MIYLGVLFQTEWPRPLTAAVYTGEKLKLKYQSHYIGMDKYHTNVGINAIDI